MVKVRSPFSWTAIYLKLMGLLAQCSLTRTRYYHL